MKYRSLQAEPRLKGAIGALVLLLWPSPMAWPQTTSQSQPEIVSHQAPATFDSRVNLVSVPVVVRDRDGRPVGGLRQEDFQLFDKGHPQEISKFSVQTSLSIAEDSKAPTTLETAAVAAIEGGAATKPELPQRYVAYLFDDVHMKPGDLLNARKAANQQLEQAFAKTHDLDTRAGIFTISGRTTQDFTGDVDKLQAAVNSIKPWEAGLDQSGDCPSVSYHLADVVINQEHSLSPGLSDNQIIGNINTWAYNGLNVVFSETYICMHMPPPAPLQGTVIGTGILQQMIGPMRNAAQLALRVGEEESKASLNTVRDLVRSMSTLPGKRTVVMLSPGFLLTEDHRLFENELFEKAIRAGVTINSLDIRGLATMPGFEASGKGGQSSYSTGQSLQYEIDAERLAQDLLGEVAAGTGGRFFHNDNGLEDGLKELAGRPEYAYVLGFSPDNLKYDGSYHGLKVTLKNGAGLQIEARRGYWAPNHSVSPAEQAKEEIQDAMFSRDEMLDIPLKLHTEFFKQNPAKAQLTIETQIDLKGLKFKKTDDRNRDKLTVVTGLFDENGRYVKGTEATVEMQLRDQTLESARNAAGAANAKIGKVSFDVAPGRYVVRVVVRDVEGRSMAARNEGVEIP